VPQFSAQIYSAQDWVLQSLPITLHIIDQQVQCFFHFLTISLQMTNRPSATGLMAGLRAVI